ncbi:hypothetical protein HYX13_00855 [Candidatus Woesearchaeota archaeon]|nr:hypothetical protein [Candidatus Woesearchaeota archaeon]
MNLEKKIQELQKKEYMKVDFALHQGLYVITTKQPHLVSIDLTLVAKDEWYTLPLYFTSSKKAELLAKQFSHDIQNAFSKSLQQVRNNYMRRISAFHNYQWFRQELERHGAVELGQFLFRIIDLLPLQPATRIKTNLIQRDVNISTEQYLGWTLVERYAEESKKKVKLFLESHNDLDLESSKEFEKQEKNSQTPLLQNTRALFNLYQTLETQARYHQTRLKRIYEGMNEEFRQRQHLDLKWRNLEKMKSVILSMERS